MSTIKNNRKDEIFNAAKKIFTEKGYNNTTMEDIIAETNLSKGGIYYYFNNKEDLCLNLLFSITSNYHDLSDNVEDYGNNNDPIENLCDYYVNFLINDNEDISIISSIYIETRHDLELRKKISEKFEGNNLNHIMDYINSNCIVEDKELLEKKIIFFLDVFHSMLYYKFIEEVHYLEQKEDIRKMFLSIFNDVIRVPKA